MEYEQISELLRYFYQSMQYFLLKRKKDDDKNDKNEDNQKLGQIEHIQEKLSDKIQILMQKKKSLQTTSLTTHTGKTNNKHILFTTTLQSSLLFDMTECVVMLTLLGKMLQNAFRCIKETSDLIYKAFEMWESTLQQQQQQQK